MTPDTKGVCLAQIAMLRDPPGGVRMTLRGEVPCTDRGGSYTVIAPACEHLRLVRPRFDPLHGIRDDEELFKHLAVELLRLIGTGTVANTQLTQALQHHPELFEPLPWVWLGCRPQSQMPANG